MTITAVQKAQRLNYLGASDAPVIAMGKLYDRTIFSLWQEKTGRAENSFQGNLSTALGDALEPLIGRQAEKQLGKKLYRAHQTVVHPEFDFIAANLDFRIGRSLPMIPVEAKFTGDYSVVKQPKIENIIQLTAQMACTGAPYGYLAYLVEGYRDDVVLHRIERDPEAIDGLTEKLCAFWYGNVLADVPPELNTHEDLAAWYGRSTEKTVDATPDLVAAVARLSVIRATVKELDLEDDQLAIDIKKAIGEAEALVWQGKAIATWKSNKDGMKFDADAAIKELLACSDEDYPAQLAILKARHSKTVPGARPLKLK